MRHRFAGTAGALVLTLAAGQAAAQQSTVPSEGITARPPRHFALQHARIVTEPGKVIAEGTIEIRDGRIVSVQAGRHAPAGAAVRDLQGKTVFAGFIDVATQVALPEDMRTGGIKALGQPVQPPHQQTLDQPGARHWNRRVRPELSVADRLDYKPEEARLLRGIGFTTVLSAPEAGVVRGQGALLALRDTAQDKDVVLARDAVQTFGFDFPAGFPAEYPGSLMGAIALIRQTLYDARWQSQPGGTERREANLALDALAPVANGEQLAMFTLDDELDVQRVSKIVREFGLKAAFVGNGYEYRVLDQAKAANVPFVLPLNFPAAPEVEKAETSLNASLAELQHWEQAPANPARVAAAGIAFSLTTRGLKDADKKFWGELRKAVKAGLREDDALRALTVAPAALVGESSRLGKVAPGQLANLVVADASLFRDDGAAVYETWIEGLRYEQKPLDAARAAGKWTLIWADGKGPKTLSLTGEGDTLDASAGTTKFKAKLDGERLLALPPATLFGQAAGNARISAVLHGDRLEGHRDLIDGRRVHFTGQRTGAAKPAAAKKDEAVAQAIPAYRGYPAGEYGRAALPAQETVVFRNATVWTNTDQGVLQNADVLVKDGRIAAVGTDLSAGGAREIDGTGLHLTPGIVDAHSHTAISRNVNEPSHAVTTEVRVADVLDPTDIDIYRQLAGGVTTANLLHGSANPMGGQNAVIKLRWGEDADGLLFEGAKPGVKFALGENVKQSGWGDGFNTRYPQTRMGVEAVMRDHFNAARDYAARRKADPKVTRRDLRLEALAEILAGERLVHIHSYRQDEILMFARLAKDYGLPVATFQHVLEGYKVADAIGEIGAGASTFADWWGYKMEVIDGIPQNGALMTRAGVLTSFNSDSNEMARRLNMEAAKAMRHGGLDEQEAFKLVTLNPAKQLRIDGRVGAIRAGMDADLVLWSDHPLSNFARAEKTFIDGRAYFDREEDRAQQARIDAERERLVQQALAERAKTLALDAGEKKGEDKKPDPAWAEEVSNNADWQVDHAAQRGLYHNGADLMSCGQHDHAH